MSITLTINTTLAAAPDTTAPVLSSGATSVVTATGWTGVITTDEGNGVLYTLVNQSPSAGALTVRDLGNMLAIMSAGAKDISFSVLTPDTTGYYAHVIHEDAAGNRSAVTTIGPFSTPSLGAGTGTVTLSIERDSNFKSGGIGIAPYTVFFRVGVSGASVSEPGNDTAFDPTVPELHYEFDGGLGQVTPGQYMQRMRTGTNDLNKGAGKYPPFCYTEPGTYTATVHVYEADGTFVGSDSVQITVANPQTVFTGNRTILVNAAGQADAAYPGAQVFTTLDLALNAQRALSQSCRILLKRGEVHIKNSQFAAAENDNNFIIADYGSGAKPTIRNTGGSFSPAMFYWSNLGNIEIAFRNIRFEGQWNSVTETGSGRNLCGIDQSSGATTRGVTFAGCEFDGWNEVCNLRITKDFYRDVILMAWDCHITNWNGFQFYSTANAGNYICLKGVSAMQSATARMGGQGDGSGNSYGLIRVQTSGRLTLEMVETLSRTSRDATLLAQPPLRINTGPSSPTILTRRPVAMISRCYIEGGGAQISLSSAESSGSNVYGMNEVVERCTLVGSNVTRNAINVSHAGVDIRNNIFIQPNGKRVPPYALQFFAFVRGDEDWISEQRDPTSPVRVRYNTFINLLDDTNRNGNELDAIEGMTVVFGGRYTEENNVLYAPNATGQGGESPIGVSQSVMQGALGNIVPAFTNVHHSATTSMPAVTPPDFSFASPTNSIWDATPLPGSALIGDANANPIFNDHAGNVRPTSRARGAMERA
jgi:hypothetical protein